MGTKLIDQELKDKLNQSRILTMSNNRKCDYLVVDLSYKVSNSAITMGIIEDKTLDIVFIKELFFKKVDELIDSVDNICYEFNINKVLTDINGMGLCFYDRFLELGSSDIHIEPIKKFNYDYITYLIRDISNYKIRLMQSEECAINGYKKPFISYLEIMNIHKETDKLLKELDNLNFEIYNGKVRIIDTENTSKSRFNCIMTYYNYKYNKENNRNNKIVNKKEIEIQKRIVQDKIVHGILYKYMFKATETENLNIIFYHNGYHKLKKFQSIIKETEFKELFNNEIKSCKISREGIEIVLFNGSNIKFIYASQGARGYKHHYAIVDNDISTEIYDNVIYTTSIDYYKNGKRQELKDKYRIEFMDFGY